MVLRDRVWTMRSGESFRRYDYLHAKYAIFDQERLFVSSENMADSSFGSNRGWAAIVESEQLCSYAESVFQRDLAAKGVDVFPLNTSLIRSEGGPGRLVGVLPPAPIEFSAEVSLLTSLLSGLVNQTSAVLNGEVVPGITGNAHPSIVPYETYPTGDRQIVIAVGNDSQFRRPCRVLGSEEWADDPRFNTNTSRVQNRQELNPLLEQRLTRQPADHWLPLLTAAGVPAGPINSVAEAIDLAAALGLDPVHEIDHPTRDRPFRTVAHPIRFSQTPARYDTPPPPLPS